MEYNFKTLTNNISEMVLYSNEHDKVIEIRDIVRGFVQNENFVIDCIKRLFTSIKNDGIDNWENPPLYVHPDNLFSIRCIVWPAYYSNNPHKHNTWSVTAIIGNVMNFSTYLWEEGIEDSTLLLDKRITGKALEIGYLLPGCIHKLSNPSSSPSLTMHVFNNVDKDTYGINNAIW